MSEAALLSCTWKRGDPTPNLNRALAKAQGEMELVIKSAIGQVGGGTDKETGQKRAERKYPYADLGAAVEAAREPLARNGLCVIQEIETLDDGVIVRTLVLHESGEERVQSLKMPIIGRTAQNYGSAMTYGRRYAFCAALNIAGEKDDDARSASEPLQSNNTTAAPAAPVERGPNGQASAIGDRLLKLDKMVAAYEAVGVPHTELARYLKHEIRFITDTEWTECRRVYAAIEKKETTWAVVMGEADALAKDDDEVSRLRVQLQAEEELERLRKSNEAARLATPPAPAPSPGVAQSASTPQSPAQMEQVLKNSIFQKLVESARRALTPELLALVGAQFSAIKETKWTEGDVKAFTRVCEDRLLILNDGKSQAKKPKLHVAPTAAEDVTQ